MRRALLLALTLLLVAPSASAAVGSIQGDVEAPAAGPGTGLRYAERFATDDRLHQTTLIVTVDGADRVEDARGEPRDAVPVTVQRLDGGEVLAAERCWGAQDAAEGLRREPIAGTSLASPLQRAWNLSGATPSGAFDRVPGSWANETTDAVFDERPCPARGPATTVDPARPTTIPLAALLPAGIRVSEDAEIEGNLSVDEASFHGRTARWVNATFGLRLPGPLPAAGDGVRPGPLHIQGETATLLAEGLPGPAHREVDLWLHAPEAPGYDRELAWEIELTGHRPGQVAELDPTSRVPEGPEHREPWTDRGPRTIDYDTAFPLEEAIATLEERGPLYQGYQARNPEAHVRSATYRAADIPEPVEGGAEPLPVRGPSWTVELTAPSGEGYRGAVLATEGGEGSASEAALGASSQDPNGSSSLRAWESPTEPSMSSPVLRIPADRIPALAPGEEIRKRLDRLGFPEGPLAGLGFEAHAPRAGAGARVTIELAVTLHAPTGTHPETARALVDGETGRPIAISESTPETNNATFLDPIPATLVEDGGSSEEGSAVSLPEGPAAGAGLAAGAALVWLLLVGLKTLLSPLFTRLSRDELLDNPTRRELLEAIREDPGVHLQRLIEEAGVGNGATRHHLDKLSDADLVMVVRHGGSVRYFPAGEFSEHEARQRATLRSGSAREVYEAYREDPGQSVRELAQRLDMSSSGVHHVVRKLREVDLIED